MGRPSQGSAMVPSRLVMSAGLLAAACGGGSGAVIAPSGHCWPYMSDGRPRGELPAGTATATLAMRTDRDAICRYDVPEGLHYLDMQNSFSITGGREHSTPLTGLVDGRIYRFSAKCEVAGGGCMNPHDLVITFWLANPQP